MKDYYQNKDEQFQNDCNALNDFLGNSMDEFADKFEDISYGERGEAIITYVMPVVLVKLVAQHFKHFNYHKPEHILNYLNYIKSVLVETCDDSDELDMIDDLDYNKQGAKA